MRVWDLIKWYRIYFFFFGQNIRSQYHLMLLHVLQISAKEDKHKKEVILLGINRKHPDYMAFKPEKRVQEPVEREKAVAESSATKQLEVVEVYKPTSHVKPIFVAVEADMEKYYSASEASDIVFRFVSPLSTTVWPCLFL